MQPHELRVHAEKMDLEDKWTKLDAFIRGVPFMDLDPVDKMLLAAQEATMRSYLEVLKMRIARFIVVKPL